MTILVYTAYSTLYPKREFLTLNVLAAVIFISIEYMHSHASMYKMDSLAKQYNLIRGALRPRLYGKLF